MKKSLAKIPARAPVAADPVGTYLNNALRCHQHQKLSRELSIVFSAASGSWFLKLREEVGERKFAPSLKRLGKSISRKQVYIHMSVAEWFQKHKPLLSAECAKIAALDFADIKPSQLELFSEGIRNALPGKTLSSLLDDIREDRKAKKKKKFKDRLTDPADPRPSGGGGQNARDYAVLALEDLQAAWEKMKVQLEHLDAKDLKTARALGGEIVRYCDDLGGGEA